MDYYKLHFTVVLKYNHALRYIREDLPKTMEELESFWQGLMKVDSIKRKGEK